MNEFNLSRRAFLRTSLAAATLPLLPAFPVLAEPAASKSKPAPKLFLFVDWFHVKKGELQVMLDPQRISEKGRKLIDTYAKDFNKKFEQGAHGFKPTDVPFGIRIVQEPAERTKPWLVADKPWEKSVTSPTVLFDEGRFRCWYSARLTGEDQKTTVDNGQVMEVSGSALAYAESQDGLNWTKPSLKILSHAGSKENNLVSPFHNGGSIFRDDNGLPEERYKGLHFDELPKDEVASGAESKARYGLFGTTSPDGYHWKKNPKPLVRYFADTVNIVGWDPLLKKYVGYFRHHLSGRTISRAETEDFWNWPVPQPILHAGPMDSPADDYYTSCYTPYPGEPLLRLIFPAIYHHDSDSVDVRLGVSRDGRTYQWTSYEPIIKLGGTGEWDEGSLYAQPNLVQLPDGRLALPYDAYNSTHNEAWFETFYGSYGNKAAIAWALWKEARLAGIQADQLGQFTIGGNLSGKQIQVNARTSRSGSVEVELREKGKAIEGFSFADCIPFSGDAIWENCRWKDQKDLAKLRGKYIELAIRLRSAKIFACRFI